MSRRAARGPSRIASSSSSPVLEDWLVAVLETPGLTSIRDPATARRMLLEDSLRGVDVVKAFEGAVADVGSGGGAPGIPLAAALPDRRITLIEAERRKADFLERWRERLPNIEVVWGRAEEQETDRYGVAMAKALAPPAVAAEWVLPLVRPGGAAVLWLGPTADLEAVARASELVGGGAPEERGGLVVIPKLRATPDGFPRRPGMARKRPLA